MDVLTTNPWKENIKENNTLTSIINPSSNKVLCIIHVLFLKRGIMVVGAGWCQGEGGEGEWMKRRKRVSV